MDKNKHKLKDETVPFLRRNLRNLLFHYQTKIQLDQNDLLGYILIVLWSMDNRKSVCKELLTTGSL